MDVCRNQMNGQVQHFALIAQRARNKMDTENTLDKLINNAKIIALYDLKKKIDKEIEDLESANKAEDEVPF